MAYRIGKCLLSERLRQAGMTQSDLAHRLGINRQQVHKWTTGEKKMSIESAKKVASLLGLACGDDLYEWIPTKRD